MLDSLELILKDGKEKNASDIHLTPGSPVMYRIDGELVPAGEKVMVREDIENLLDGMVDKEQLDLLGREGELDFSCSVGDFYRIRVNIYRQRGSYAMALRVFSETVPMPRELGIPEAVVELTERESGLILVTGTAGSGKTTTMASLVSVISQNCSKSIITIENPIEYLLPHNNSVISQREVGSDTRNYVSALRGALKQDPDVIMVGELCDLVTIEAAITAAETGHLVIAALHTESTVDAIGRMVDIFPPHQQQQIRVQLSGVLVGIISRRLLSRQGGSGRIAAYEVLLSDSEVSNMIRENKIHQLVAMLQSGRKEGMQWMDDSILDLYMKSCITAETAIKSAQDPVEMERKVTM